MKVIVTQEAKRNLLNIFYYNLNISLNYAIKIDKKIRSYFKDLQFYPYIGRYVPEIQSSHYQERIYKNYRIIYVVSEKYNTIFIRYIFSSRQDKVTFFEVHKKEIFDFLNFFI